MRTTGRALSSCLGFGESAMSREFNPGASDAGAAGSSFRRAPRPCAGDFFFPLQASRAAAQLFLGQAAHMALFSRGLAAKSGRKAIEHARIARGAAPRRAATWRGPARACAWASRRGPSPALSARICPEPSGRPALRHAAGIASMCRTQVFGCDLRAIRHTHASVSFESCQRLVSLAI